MPRHQGPHKDAPGSIRRQKREAGARNFLFLFWPHLTVCEILVHWPGMEPTPAAVGAQSLNHWTREVFTVVFMGRNG